MQESQLLNTSGLRFEIISRFAKVVVKDRSQRNTKAEIYENKIKEKNDSIQNHSFNNKLELVCTLTI